jgi:D-alanyl-D-alanine carboxypeptidase/D-alanyl-D-alanine-endopeptidase (penicillin-binding protein 4)
MRVAFFAFTVLLAACSPTLHFKKEISKAEKRLQNHIGFYLKDYQSKKILADYRGDRYFTPASNTKIFTFYTSLCLLGDSVPSIKYFYKSDSLIFEGLGDPSFLYPATYSNTRTFDFLSKHNGPLFFYSKNFKSEPYGPGWAWDDYNAYYSAERSAFPVYGNLISISQSNGSFKFFPSRFSSTTVMSVDIHPEEEFIRDIDSNELTYFPGKKSNTTWQIPFRTGDDLTSDLLSDTLHRNVDEYGGYFPSDAKILKSVPADSLYKTMMQDSDNFIAEQLLLQCAAMLSDTLKTEIAIRHSLKNLLNDLPDQPIWVDGSGLSRYNLFTPRSIVALWEKIYQKVPESRLLPLLATGGKSGTIKNHYKAEKPFIFGKTGSLSNNHCLSGFLFTKKGHMFIFSFMNNNFVAPTREVREVMQSILKEAYEKY